MTDASAFIGVDAADEPITPARAIRSTRTQPMGYAACHCPTAGTTPLLWPVLAAATLIGLLFVAVTVGTAFSTSSILDGARLYLTPSLIRFGGALFFSLAGAGTIGVVDRNHSRSGRDRGPRLSD
jgi:hypothetical protein